MNIKKILLLFVIGISFTNLGFSQSSMVENRTEKQIKQDLDNQMDQLKVELNLNQNQIKNIRKLIVEKNKNIFLIMNSKIDESKKTIKFCNSIQETNVRINNLLNKEQKVKHLELTKYNINCIQNLSN